jgi:hypothetical protein
MIKRLRKLSDMLHPAALLIELVHEFAKGLSAAGGWTNL